MKSKQLTVFPVLAAMGLNKSHCCVYASLNIPSSLKIWSRRCVPLQMLFLKVSKNKRSSSSSRRRWRTKRNQQGTEQPSSHKESGCQLGLILPCQPPPTTNLYKLEKKKKAENYIWEETVQDANRWNHHKGNFRETLTGHSEGKRNSKRTVKQWWSPRRG